MNEQEKLAEELMQLWHSLPVEYWNPIVKRKWLRVAAHVLKREEGLRKAVGVCQANAELLWSDNLLTADQRFYIAKISDAATNALSAEKPESKG